MLSSKITMAKLSILVAALCISSALCAPGDNRIIGGQDALPGQFPHQISMQSNGQHICGGSILNPTKILTAAHCVYGNNEAIDVVAGIDNLTQPGQRVRVAQVSYHADFNSSTLAYDVAILILSAPLTFNQLVQPISLATVNPEPGSNLTLSGWGYVTYPPTGPTLQLQTITLTALSLQNCANYLQGYYPIRAGNVCTTSPPGYGSCKYDSGGPLIDQDKVQVGIVSWGVPCALGLPDVYTSVAFFLNYINSVN